MNCTTRHVADVLLVDCYGWPPRTVAESDQLVTFFRSELSGRDKVVFVVHDIDFADDMRVRLGLLFRAFDKGGIERGGLGLPPFIHFVSNNERFLGLCNVIDSPMRGYSTEEKAIAYFSKKKFGCLWFVLGALAFAWVSLATA